MNRNKKIKIMSYEQIIAGLLVQLGTIDTVDFSLLIGDFQRKTKIEVGGLSYYFPNIGKYIKVHRNGNISLREEATLDDFIKKENCSVREKFLEVAGNFVREYLESFNITKYERAKRQLLLENKEKVLKSANVLLISDIACDYNSMKEYGFKNIDYFKSIIRAEHYFEEHPEDLEKYQIIIRGNQSVQRYLYEELESQISSLKSSKNILRTTLSHYHFNDDSTYISYLCDKINGRDFEVVESSYFAVFDRIIENMLINSIMENEVKTSLKFREYTDYINPNRLVLPMKKADLKILYLDDTSVKFYAQDLAQTLGLNIVFEEDNNFSLQRHVQKHLGDYDIIIASSIYSKTILEMSNESTEQCKDTGRDLTLLVTYETEAISQIDEDDCLSYGQVGSEVMIEYVYGGIKAKDTVLHRKEFRVAKEENALTRDKDLYIQGEYANTKSIISASLYAYNEALLQHEKRISDLDLKTIEEYDMEYLLLEEQEKSRINNALAPIKAIDEIRFIVLSYLNYKKGGRKNISLKDLKITEKETSIRVEGSYNGRVLCAITFLKQYENKNIRIFEVEVPSKRGILQDPKKVGVYTKKYENIENLPKRPDENQASALLSIWKKVKYVLGPINEKMGEQKRLVKVKSDTTL